MTEVVARATALAVAAATAVAGCTQPALLDPAVSTPTYEPVAPYPGELTTAIQAVLPPGADVAMDARSLWPTDGLPQRNLYGIPYRIHGRRSVAVVSVPPSRLLWDLQRDGPADLQPAEAWPLTLTDFGPGVVAVAPDESILLLLSFDGAPHVSLRLPLPSGVRPPPAGAEPWPALREHDLTGDAVPDPILYMPAKGKAEPVLGLYQRMPNNTARLVHTAGRGAVLHDYDRNGLLDVITPGTSGSWDLWRWQGDAYAVVERLAAPPVREPIKVVAEALPALPANLTFQTRGGGAVQRWPKGGGALQTLWRAEEGGTALRGFRVSGDSSHVLYELQEPGEGSPSPRSLALHDVGTGALITLPTRGDLRGYAISRDGSRIVYLGIGVGRDGAPLPRPSTSSPGPRESGTLFVIDTADPSAALGIADCQRTVVQESLTQPCRDDIALADDGAQVAYADGRGLWVVDLPRGAPRLALRHYLPPLDESATRLYLPQRWSPDGRHLLVAIGGWEGSGRAVLDTVNGSVVEVLDSWVGGGPYSELAWFPAGDALLVTRWLGETPLRIVAAAAPDEAAPLWDTLPLHPDVQYHAIGAAVAPDGTIRFALRQWEALIGFGNGVFRAERDGTSVVKLAVLPPVPLDDENEDTGMVTWSSNADAFLAIYSESGAVRALVGTADWQGPWDASQLLEAATRSGWDGSWVAWSN